MAFSPPSLLRGGLSPRRDEPVAPVAEVTTVAESEFGAGELEDVALHGLVAVVDDDQRGGRKK